MSNKIQAQQKAVEMAIADLSGVNIAQRCQLLGLTDDITGENIKFNCFGKEVQLNTINLQLTFADSGEPIKLGDQILILHYLKCDVPVNPGGELVTFRDFPGGQFYLQPFLSRSAKPLTGRVKNDIELLKKNLDRFEWNPAEFGDFSARVHAFGNLFVTLVYHLGDEEFPPSAEVFFDDCLKRVYQAEDSAFLASRICIGLL